MNIMDKWAVEDGLRARLAAWMEKHGEVLFNKSQSNSYVGIRIQEIRWMGRVYRVTSVDWTTSIERIDNR